MNESVLIGNWIPRKDIYIEMKLKTLRWFINLSFEVLYR